MPVRTAIFFDIGEDLKTQLETRFKLVKTTWAEIFREASRRLLDMPEADVKDFLLDAKKHDLEESLVKFK